MALKTNYVDDALNQSVNTQRMYRISTNASGLSTITDQTSYSTVGSSFGASDINAITTKVNEIDNKLGQQVTYSWNADTATLTITTK